MNKYYEMFINDNVNESIFKINSNALTFEDHFWHYACMSTYYKKHNDFYMYKKCLTAACDMNYYYNAFLYFDAFGVLPQNFKKYIKKFEHAMKNDKLEQYISEANQKDKRTMKNGFWLYSLGSLLIIPLMLLLVFVFGLDTTVAAVISMIAIFVGQGMINPMVKQRKQAKYMKRESLLTKEEKSLFSYMKSFDNVIRNEKYVALLRVDNDDDRNVIISCIKNNRPIPEEVLNQKKKKQKNNKQENNE